MQTIIQSKIETDYEPGDFFEAPYAFECDSYRLEINDGLACMSFASDQPNEELFNTSLKAIFDRRKIQTRQPYSLAAEPRRVRYDHQGNAHYTLHCEAAEFSLSGGEVHFLLRDKDGNVIRDTRAEKTALEAEEKRCRIEVVNNANDNLLSVLPKGALLVKLGASYAAAIDDPGDEFVHLREIYEALLTEFGRKSDMCERLDLDTDECEDAGRLYGLVCNGEIKQSAHRGQHLGTLRSATTGELQFARKTSLLLIERYEQFLKRD